MQDLDFVKLEAGQVLGLHAAVVSRVEDLRQGRFLGKVSRAAPIRLDPPGDILEHPALHGGGPEVLLRWKVAPQGTSRIQ
eukprot:6259511-Pyramimonas_sp.AAC.1